MDSFLIGGISISHFLDTVSSGTLGIIVKKKIHYLIFIMLFIKVLVN